MTDQSGPLKSRCPYCGDTGLMPLTVESKGLPGKLPSSLVLKQTFCVCEAGRDLARRSGASEPDGAPDNAER